MGGVTELAGSRPYTVDDLDAMPDDGRRRELIDGMLLVTPAPGWPHQEMVLTLYLTLRAVCPSALRVLAAPFAVRTSGSDEVRPDVPSYWLLDPRGPGELTVPELDEAGRYREGPRAHGDEAVRLERPFPVTLSPARLLDGLRPA